MYFENVVDIWYLVGSFVVPALLFPLIAGLYQIEIKYASFAMSIPMAVSVWCYLYNTSHPLIGGYIGLIFGQDPMYPGILVSGILFYLWKK